MGLSSAGIGSGLDIDGIVNKLMSAEQGPLDRLARQAATYQGRLSAFSKLGSALGMFQGSLVALGNSSTFQAQTVTPSDKSVLTGTATSGATPGNYNIRVSQLAQAQSLTSSGFASTTATVGGGLKSTLTFSWGAVTGGQFGTSGVPLSASIAATGITSGSLSINGTVIDTSSATKTAKQLADAINAQNGTTGVTARFTGGSSAPAMFGASGAPTFGNVATTGTGSSYALTVNGIQIAAQGAATAAGSGVTAASIDTALTGTNAVTNALAAANITFTGSAVNGDLQFFAADGSNLNVSETVSGSVTGGLNNSGTANAGSSATSTGLVNLVSASGSPITIGGSNPAAAGLAAGPGGRYIGSTYAPDGTQSRGTVVLDAGDQSLQGIRDAINKAGIGVTASIVSDGSANPYHLVLTSTATGAASSMKIELSDDTGGTGDPQLAAILGYDPAGTQNLRQTSAGQSTVLDVNGVQVTSKSNNVGEAIQGVNLSVSKLGSTTVTVAKDTKSITDAVAGFVKAYNDLNSTIKGLTSYNSATQVGGVLQGDATVRSIQSQLRSQLGAAITDSGASLTTLSQVGIAFQKDGSLAVDSTKLNNAISSNYNDFANLFAAVGTSTSSLVSFASASSATKPGTYAVSVSQPATKGNMTSAAKVPALTTILPNTVWNVTLDQTDPVDSERTQAITIKAGSYTPSELAALLSSSINGNSKFAGAGLTAEAEIDSSGNLSLSSSRWGASSNISLMSESGSGVADIFGAVIPSAGKDVVGTIGGAGATGNGQSLTGAAGSKAEGLKLTITGSAQGNLGSITFSQGFAYQLTNMAASFIGVGGMVTGRTTGLNTSMKNLDKQRESENTRLTDIEKRYRAQFTALDTAMASLQSTQNYLTQQLASIAKNS
jgi:flagellar hook-associated protein 2